MKYPYLKGKWEWVIGSRSYYFREGLTYSCNCNGSLGIRILPNKAIFDPKGPGIFPFSIPIEVCLSALSTRAVSYMLRAICPGLDFNPGYVSRAPIPPAASWNIFEQLGKICLSIARELNSNDILEMDFSPLIYRIIQPYDKVVDIKMSFEAVLHGLEGIIEKKLCDAFELNHESIEDIIYETGKPAGWYPLISGLDKIPVSSEYTFLNEDIKVLLASHEHIVLSDNKLKDIRVALRANYEAGPGEQIDSDDIDKISFDNNENNNGELFGANIPFPLETFLEQLSQKAEIHPISVYWLLKEGIEKEGWRCKPEEKRFIEDRFTVMALRLLGYRWPKQIESGEPLPDWADDDGIIPLAETHKEQTLLQRVKERIKSEFPGGNVASIEREFAEIAGVSLEKWLSDDFFKRHIPQFKKRPIAWQLSSVPLNVEKGLRRGRANRTPVFSCLIYYHRLDKDLLPKLRSQYLGPLRSRFETELITLERSPLTTPEQAERKVQLINWIEEIKTFDCKLEAVINGGFSSPKLDEVILVEPLDKWAKRNGVGEIPTSNKALLDQESYYDPDLNDGVRVNIAPLQKAGLLAADVLAKKDVEKAIADRAEWRADERRWCREGKLPKPGWWK